MRALAIIFLALLLVGGLAVTFLAVSSLRTAQQAAEPIGDLVRKLVLEATPVILPDSAVIVQEINDLARLETASMTLQQVVTAERNQEQIWGILGESLIFVAYGDVIAGVDLAKMTEADLVVMDPQTVVVHLPEAEIFVATLDNQRSYVADRDKGFLARPDPQLETAVRQTAEQQILNAALEAGVLERANVNAENYMRTFLNGLGFANVTFTDTTPPPAPTFDPVIPKGYVVTPVAP